jgi:hypothetical protein
MSDERILVQPGTRAVPARIGAPRIVAYEYRARTYPWAVRALAASEARYGRPGPLRADWHREGYR